MTKELREALLCLRIEVAESIANDVEAKVLRALAESRAEGIEAAIKMLRTYNKKHWITGDIDSYCKEFEAEQLKGEG